MRGSLIKKTVKGQWDLKYAKRRINHFTCSSWMISNLSEAHFALGAILKEVNSNPDFDPERMCAYFDEVYYHVNIAWNSRKASMRQVHRALTEKDEKVWNKWKQFPGEFA